MNNLTLPNLLSVSRFLLAPIIYYFVIQNDWLLASAIFAYAVVSDVLDGYLARQRQQSSIFGGLLDHASDAIFVASILLAEAVLGYVPWVLPILVSFAFIQYTLDSKVLTGQALKASRLGRYNGILYFVLAAMPLLINVLGLQSNYENNDVKAIYIAGAILSLTTIVSMADRTYTYINLKQVN